jgi:hypothetical protein
LQLTQLFLQPEQFSWFSTVLLRFHNY